MFRTPLAGRGPARYDGGIARKWHHGREETTVTARLSGKRALVTAAAQGIGRASALAFAREGATVIATDVNEAKLAELASIRGIEIRRLDVRDSQAVKDLAAEVGTIDILLNAAAYVHHGTLLEYCD